MSLVASQFTVHVFVSSSDEYYTVGHQHVTQLAHFCTPGGTTAAQEENLLI